MKYLSLLAIPLICFLLACTTTTRYQTTNTTTSIR